MTPLHPPPPSAFLYEDPTVSVTASQLRVGTAVYEIHTLTAARVVAAPPQRAVAKLMVLMAGFGAVAGGWKMLTEGAPLWVPMGIAGLFLVLAVAAFVTEGPTNALRLWTAQGEVDALFSDDLKRLHEIAAALARAAQSP